MKSKSKAKAKATKKTSAKAKTKTRAKLSHREPTKLAAKKPARAKRGVEREEDAKLATSTAPTSTRDQRCAELGRHVPNCACTEDLRGPIHPTEQRA